MQSHTSGASTKKATLLPLRHTHSVDPLLPCLLFFLCHLFPAKPYHSLSSPELDTCRYYSENATLCIYLLSEFDREHVDLIAWPRNTYFYCKVGLEVTFKLHCRNANAKYAALLLSGLHLNESKKRESVKEAFLVFTLGTYLFVMDVTVRYGRWETGSTNM